MPVDNLMNITQVKEVENVGQVNTLLTEGWKLLATYSYAPYVGEPTNLRLVYSLGLPEKLPF